MSLSTKQVALVRDNEEVGEIVQDLIAQFLELPGFEAAVTQLAMEHWADQELKYLHNLGISSLGHLPYCYLNFLVLGDLD